MKVNEIFKSIQGESTCAGLPCTFIRLTGCNLRCSYCDTQYAYEEGRKLTTREILSEVRELRCPLVEITGGEPLLQEEVYPLMGELLKENYKLLLETNGSLDIGRTSPQVIKIMDIKCPDSGMCARMNWKNLEKLNPKDEIKFVLSSQRDYDWAKSIIREKELDKKVTTVLVSPAFDKKTFAKADDYEVAAGFNLRYKLEPKIVAEWILRDALNVRLQLQLHKYIWKQIV